MGEFRERRNPSPIYFYCVRNPTEPERAKPDAILRSLVGQLSYLLPGQAILEPIWNFYQVRKKDAFATGPLTPEESTALIIDLSQYRGLTTIIIDALDECDLFLRVSSRDDRDIYHHLADCLNLEI